MRNTSHAWRRMLNFLPPLKRPADAALRIPARLRRATPAATFARMRLCAQLDFLITTNPRPADDGCGVPFNQVGLEKVFTIFTR